MIFDSYSAGVYGIIILDSCSYHAGICGSYNRRIARWLSCKRYVVVIIWELFGLYGEKGLEVLIRNIYVVYLSYEDMVVIMQGMYDVIIQGI